MTVENINGKDKLEMNPSRSEDAMDKETRTRKVHCLLLTYPTQGHLNPLLQFSKRLLCKGVQVTLVTTRFISKSLVHAPSSPVSIAFETISDGYDNGGRIQAESIKVYMERFRQVGSQTLVDLVQKLRNSGPPVDCIIYDSFLPWGLDVAKKLGLVGAPFFTQACAVNIVYYQFHRGVIKLPLTEAQVLVPTLPPLNRQDVPSFIDDVESYPAFLDMVLDQFSNIDKSDLVLCNTFFDLEQKGVDWLANIRPWKTIGPTVPSMYLDKLLENDTDYGFSVFKPKHDACLNWLNAKPNGSVTYVSFGSTTVLSVEQVEELCCGLKRSNTNFLWVVRESEEGKLPKHFLAETKEKGLVVSWCSQLEVLSHNAIGCFLTHCGWNSTMEALSLGVPLVAMPQWTDQSTNAKCITDVWKVGLRVSADEKGTVKQETIKRCIWEITEGEQAEEIKMNAQKWRDLAKKAVKEGGSSDLNINEFVAKLKN